MKNKAKARSTPKLLALCNHVATVHRVGVINENSISSILMQIHTSMTLSPANCLCSLGLELPSLVCQWLL